MAIAPKNPPNYITLPNAATPTQLVVDGAFVSSINPIPTTTGGATTSSVTTNYICINPFTDTAGAVAADDQLINLQIFNSLGALVTDVWNDVTAAFTLDAAPPAGDVEIYIPGGGATAANQTIEIGLLTDITGQLPATLGQKLSAASLSTVLASDATLPLPTGAATAALQTDGNTSLSTIATQSTISANTLGTITGQLPPTLGLQAEANSMSVVVANALTSDISASALYTATNTAAEYNTGDILQSVEIYAPGTPSTLVDTVWNNLTQGTVLTAAPLIADITPSLGGGDATAANQALQITEATTTNTTLSAISAQLPPALGVQDTANSLSVYVSNQSTLSNVPVVNQYVVINAFVSPSPGAAVGDILQLLEVYDATTDPATLVSSSWSNLTTGDTYASAPTPTDIEPIGGTGLTDAELRATPVDMTPVLPEYTVSNTTETASGTTTAGCVQLSFANIGAANATVGGAALPPGSALSYTAPAGGTIGAVAFDATGTTLLIATLS